MDDIDLKLLTISQLIRFLLLIIFEVAQRFRIPIPEAPTGSSPHPPHCHEKCNFCDHLCARADRHRTHRCAAHWR